MKSIKAGGGFPVFECGVLLVGAPHLFADALVRNHFIRRLAQDSRARDCELAHHRVELALDADRPAEQAIFFKIARRVRHHSKNVGVAVLVEDFTRAVACTSRIAIVDAGHGSLPDLDLLACRLLDGSSIRTVSGSLRLSNCLRGLANQPRLRTRNQVSIAFSSIRKFANLVTRESKCRRITIRPWHGRYSLSGDSIKANTRRGVFRVEL